MTDDLYLPNAPSAFDEPAVSRWFANVTREHLSSGARGMLDGYYREAGLLESNWHARYFHYHYGTSLRRAIPVLFRRSPKPHILDLGCGTGTQSILFALLGARVTAIDMDADGLEVLRERKALYEATVGKSLEIEIVQGDARQLHSHGIRSVDGVHSLFALQMMQPVVAVLDELNRVVSPSADLFVHNGNPRWLGVNWRPTYQSTGEFLAALEMRGWSANPPQPLAALPEAAWRLSGLAGFRWVEDCLTRHASLSKSAIVIAARLDSSSHT